jgi:hypothetical protein
MYIRKEVATKASKMLAVALLLLELLDIVTDFPWFHELVCGVLGLEDLRLALRLADLPSLSALVFAELFIWADSYALRYLHGTLVLPLFDKLSIQLEYLGCILVLLVRRAFAMISTCTLSLLRVSSLLTNSFCIDIVYVHDGSF